MDFYRKNRYTPKHTGNLKYGLTRPASSGYQVDDCVAIVDIANFDVNLAYIGLI